MRDLNDPGSLAAIPVDSLNDSVNFEGGSIGGWCSVFRSPMTWLGPSGPHGQSVSWSLLVLGISKRLILVVYWQYSHCSCLKETVSNPQNSVDKMFLFFVGLNPIGALLPKLLQSPSTCGWFKCLLGMDDAMARWTSFQRFSKGQEHGLWTLWQKDVELTRDRFFWLEWGWNCDPTRVCWYFCGMDCNRKSHQEGKEEEPASMWYGLGWEDLS